MKESAWWLHNVKRCSGQSDRLSSLSDDLLRDILHRLPTKDAVATSVLSRRWRPLYTWLTTLEFDARPLYPRLDDPQLVACFLNYVNNVLLACKSTDLSRLCLKLGRADAIHQKGHCIDLKFAHLFSWITFLLTRRCVKELDLCAHVTRPPGKLPSQLFFCSSLEVLKIDTNLELELPSSFCLPKLKALHLCNVDIPSTDFLTALLLSCPTLEELVAKYCTCADSEVIYISKSSLRRLVLDIYPAINEETSVYLPLEGRHQLFVSQQSYERSKVVLDTPNLQYLEYNDNLAWQYTLGDLNRLSEAIIRIMETLDDEKDCLEIFHSLLSQLTNVQYLYLSAAYLDELLGDVEEDKKPLGFPNLNHLQLWIHTFREYKVLFDLLHCSPLLQKLTLPEICHESDDDGMDDKHVRLTAQFQSMTQGIPSCFKCHLKKIVIQRYGALDEELLLVKYFLRNALVLEELEVVCLSRLDSDIIESFLKELPRASRNCSIKVKSFVYKLPELY